MGKIFGGYTDIPWESSGEFKGLNGNSFIFSLRDDCNFVKLKNLEELQEVYHDKDYLCAFGLSGGFYL